MEVYSGEEVAGVSGVVASTGMWRGMCTYRYVAGTYLGVAGTYLSVAGICVVERS